jgi:hypothetical protein
VPYITTWSSEQVLCATVVEHGWSGIRFADEILADRDEHGVLWQREPSRPGHGRPLYGQVHSLRQRRVMRRLRCGVCAGPADRAEQGVLWLLRDHRDDWPGWPEGMGVTEPPVCLPCARVSVHACPALRKGSVTIRAGRSAVSGVYGVRYQSGRSFPAGARDELVSFDDPAIRWTCAAQLVRQLSDCTIVNIGLSI